MLLRREKARAKCVLEAEICEEVECALRRKDANFVLLDFTVAINIFC